MNVEIKGIGVTSPGSEYQSITLQRSLEPREIAVTVEYCTLTFGDTRFVLNAWGDSRYPLIPGSEVIGSVLACGEQAELFREGDSVGVGYQVGACFQCPACIRGEEQFCRYQQVVAVHAPGGLANIFIADERLVLPLSTTVRRPSAAPFLCSGLTVYSALRRANIPSGALVGVVGVGNLGHLALILLSALGYQTVGFTHKEEKIRPEIDIVYANQEEHLLAWQDRFDLILWTSTSNNLFPTFLSTLKPTGTMSVLGLPSENLQFRPEILADFSSRTIRGGYIGSRRELGELFDLVQRHALAASIECYAVSEVQKLHRRIHDGGIRFSAVISVAATAPW